MIKKWENSFNIHSNTLNCQHQIVLREKKNSSKNHFPRYIVVLISCNSMSFSITSYEIQEEDLKVENYNQKYTIEVEGDQDTATIIKHLTEIIQGKDDDVFEPNYHF